MTDQAAEWSEIILNYAELGNWTEVNQLIYRIEDDLTKEQTLVELITKRLIKGDFQEAENLGNQITNYPNYIAQGRARIGGYYLLANKPEQANKMFTKAMNVLKEIDQDYADMVKNDVYTVIAVEYWLGGDKNKANQVLAMIDNTDEKAKFWSEIAQNLAVKNEFDNALNSLDNINKLPKNKDYNSIDYYQDQALSNIAKYASTEQLTILIEYLNQIIDPTYKNAALAEIIKRYLELENYQQADFLIKELNDTNGDLLTFIIYEYAKNGKLDTANRLINTIENEYWKTESRIKMMAGLARKGEDEQALIMAKEITVLEVKLPALMAIAEAYIETNKYQLALNLLEQLNKTATEELNKNQDLDEKYLVLSNIKGTSNYLISMVKCGLINKLN